MSPLAIERRLDRLALEQLRVVAARQSEEIDELRRQLAFAEQCADSWRVDALRFMEEACERTGGTPALTLVMVVPPGEAPK